MTTPEQNTDEMVGEQPEIENPLFLISTDRLDKFERSPVHLIAGRLTATSPSKSKPINELGDVKGLIREIAQNYKDDPNFIRSDMPVQEIIFRTMLARSNRPIALCAPEVT